MSAFGVVSQFELQKKTFDDLLLEAINEALSSLGETPKTAIYFHLEKTFNIKKQEIPHRIEDFTSALEEIFGLGAMHLEILFMKHLHAKIGGVYEWVEPKDFTFPTYVHMIKQNLVYKSENGKEMEKVNECNHMAK
jgi:hypothetical protein